MTEKAFNAEDFDFFIKVMRRSTIMLLAVFLFFALLLFFFGWNSVILFNFEFPFYFVLVGFAIWFTTSYFKLILDLLCRKKIHVIGFMKIKYTPGGEIDAYIPQLAFEDYSDTIDLDGGNSWVLKSQISEEGGFFQVQFTKYSRTILSIKPS